jgi:hypothetical protein
MSEPLAGSPKPPELIARLLDSDPNVAKEDFLRILLRTVLIDVPCERLKAYAREAEVPGDISPSLGPPEDRLVDAIIGAWLQTASTKPPLPPAAAKRRKRRKKKVKKQPTEHAPPAASTCEAVSTSQAVKECVPGMSDDIDSSADLDSSAEGGSDSESLTSESSYTTPVPIPSTATPSTATPSAVTTSASRTLVVSDVVVCDLKLDQATEDRIGWDIGNKGDQTTAGDELEEVGWDIGDAIMRMDGTSTRAPPHIEWAEGWDIQVAVEDSQDSDGSSGDGYVIRQAEHGWDILPSGPQSTYAKTPALPGSPTPVMSLGSHELNPMRTIYADTAPDEASSHSGNVLPIQNESGEAASAEVQYAAFERSQRQSGDAAIVCGAVHSMQSIGGGLDLGEPSCEPWAGPALASGADAASGLPPILRSAIVSKRERIVNELVSTERKYVSRLEILVTVFLRPLQAAQIMTQQDAMKAIFSAAETILMLHRDLVLHDLEHHLAYDADPQQAAQHPKSIGQIFQEFSPYMRACMQRI